MDSLAYQNTVTVARQRRRIAELEAQNAKLVALVEQLQEQPMAKLTAIAERLAERVTELEAKGRVHGSIITMLKERTGLLVIDELIPFDGAYYPDEDEPESAWQDSRDAAGL